MLTAVVIGTLDTKGDEYAFVRDVLRAQGLSVCVVDIGVLGPPAFAPDVDAADVARAGGRSLEEIRFDREGSDTRGVALDVMARGATAIVADLRRRGRCDGVFGMGGSGGSTVIATALQSLPLGVPKLLVSTMASGDVSPYVGCTDVCLMYSVTDIAGLNRISRQVLSNGALALAGMINGRAQTASPEDGPVVGISMLGVTTRGVRRVAARLEAKGFEVVIFHAVGAGGRAMERLVEDGTLDGLVDFTPSELTDEMFNGIFSAGPDRCQTAARLGVPQVVVPGAIEVLNFGPVDAVPPVYRSADRRLIRHNRAVTAVRLERDEEVAVGEELARRLGDGAGSTVVMVPTLGLDDYEGPAGPYCDPEADAAMFAALRRALPRGIPVIEVDRHINDREFADEVADTFVALYRSAPRGCVASSREKRE